MRIEDQLCPELQARKLMKLGVIQAGQFSWLFSPSSGKMEVSHLKVEALELLAKSHPKSVEWKERTDVGIFSAFSCAELGLMLKGYNTPFYWGLWNEWCFKENGNPRGYGTEATARAEYLIHLINTNNITVEEVNQRLSPSSDK